MASSVFCNGRNAGCALRNVKAINLTLHSDGCWEFASSNGPGSWVSRTGYLKLCYSIRKTNVFLFGFYSEQII